MVEEHKMTGQGGQRRTDLEAFRGIAAITVVVHHFLLAFAPEVSGFLPEYRNQDSWVGSAWFGLINGKAAVYFFFVLSGYVLSVQFLRDGNLSRLRAGVIKRLPRLAYPVMLSCLLAYLAMKTGVLYNFEASAYTGSVWLRNLGFGHDLASFSPSFFRAITESVTVFLNGVNRYNSSLWSMQPEMTGSLLVMSGAVFFRVLLQMRYLVYSGALVFVIVARLDPMLCAFLLGLFVALAHAKFPQFEMNRMVSWACLLLGIYLCGFIAPSGAYGVFERLPVPVEQVYTLGGTLVLLSVVFCAPNFSMLNGRVGRLLGQQSFPTYLLHTTILGTATSYAFLFLRPTMSLHWLLPLLLGGTLLLTVVLALGMHRMDLRWVNYLNERSRRLGA